MGMERNNCVTRFLHTSDWQLGMTRHFLSGGVYRPPLRLNSRQHESAGGCFAKPYLTTPTFTPHTSPEATRSRAQYTPEATCRPCRSRPSHT